MHSVVVCTCRYRQAACHHHINAVNRERVKLLVWTPHEFVFEEVATLAIELKESHILLHREVWGRQTNRHRERNFCEDTPVQTIRFKEWTGTLHVDSIFHPEITQNVSNVKYAC